MDLDSIVNYLTENQIDAIVHCAAKVGGIKANSEHLGKFYYENIMMNTNVLEAARIAGVKKVVSFLSTCVFPADASFPLTTDQIHQGEPHPSNYAYAYAKRMLEVQSRAYRDQYGCNFVTVIPCNIYGPHDNYNLDSGHVIPSLIHKCYLAKQNGTDFEIWGTGKPYREFIYSDDIGTITQWVLENYDDPEPLIISPDNEISIGVLAQMIVWQMRFEGNVVVNGKQDGQFRKPSDNSKLKAILPNYNFVPIESGIQKSIDWFVANYEDIRK
jgi:GDP-L-fucose synthase